MRDNDKVLCAYTPGQLGWLEGPIVKYYSNAISDPGPGGNNNGAADPGESVTMPVTLKNWGLPATGVSATLSTTDPYITISSNYSTYPDMGLNGTGTSSTPYAFSSSPSTPAAHVVTFTLTIVSTGYDTTATFTVRIGEAPILLVDDDNGATYETYYKDALNANGYGYANWVVKTQGSPSLSELSKRKVVIWFTSLQATVTLTGVDETNLGNYLNAGGSLFFSSEEYLTERFETFAHNYLHVQDFVMDAISSSETGVAGDTVSNGMNLTMSYPFGNYSDDIFPDANSRGIFINSTLNPGALRYPAVGTSAYKVVFFAFPFEAIANGTAPNNRSTVMKRVVDWLLAPQDYQPPSVAVSSPNGGEEWDVGSEHAITWTASDNVRVDSISIYCSLDGGSTFPDTVAMGLPNTSSYNWLVPDTPSDSCVIKVVAYDNSLNEGMDVSNALFAIKSITGIEGAPKVAGFGLMQNHPNPFNPLTNIEFNLSETARVTLRIYDVSGKLVKTLVAETMSDGLHRVVWRGDDEEGRGAASGVYVCRLESNGRKDIRKMVLLR